MSISQKHGIALLQDSSLNKSTAFTEEEKQLHGLVGLVPDLTETEGIQLQRVMQQLATKDTDLERYIYLINLLDHNERLFYRTIMSDPARFLPIVYDPTIGEACLKFGHIYRQPRGMYLSITRRGKVKEILKNWPERRTLYLRDQRWTHSRAGRYRSKRDGNPHRQIATLHSLCGRTTSALVTDVS